MEPNKSLDVMKMIIAALLTDVQKRHDVVFNYRALDLTLKVLDRRLDSEGSGFLTKTLPRLGKALDKCLAQSGIPMQSSSELGFQPKLAIESNAEGDESLQLLGYPRFLGELFGQILDKDGIPLPDPCTNSIKDVRQILYLFYKYELPYTDEQENAVISSFEKTEDDLKTYWDRFPVVLEADGETLSLTDQLEANDPGYDDISYYNSVKPNTRFRFNPPLEGDVGSSGSTIRGYDKLTIVRRARNLLKRLFCSFDCKDIYPKHGPGSVATRQIGPDKYKWNNVCSRITDMYAFDTYFCASLGHVCDEYRTFDGIGTVDLSARVVLVPKDSRGPRLISCEPVDFQWVQQGLGRAIVEHMERHPLSKWNVRFSDQQPNRIGALLGSLNGRYATLDLKEASDRVSVDLVRLIFPSELYAHLVSLRSLSTELPSGKVINLRKFAPMGSSLCFPVLALTTWALLTAASPDAYARERVYVYGDDVIVQTTEVENAISTLESFGLLVNRDKSCTSGFFRESCGMDAYKGYDITPVKLKTVWSSNRRPSVLSAWISYANSMWDRRNYCVYNKIVDGLLSPIYGPLPSEQAVLTALALAGDNLPQNRIPRRVNADFQKVEHYIWDIRTPVQRYENLGWIQLLRYFSEKVGRPKQLVPAVSYGLRAEDISLERAFRSGQYTKRDTSVLVKRWR